MSAATARRDKLQMSVSCKNVIVFPQVKDKHVWAPLEQNVQVA
jgi:hypothetical protein